ncbi:unnamed protein product, partial [Polarella glacialis]
LKVNELRAVRKVGVGEPQDNLRSRRTHFEEPTALNQVAMQEPHGDSSPRSIPNKARWQQGFPPGSWDRQSQGLRSATAGFEAGDALDIAGHFPDASHTDAVRFLCEFVAKEEARLGLTPRSRA